MKSRTAVGALTCDEDVMSCDVRTSKDKQVGVTVHSLNDVV